ncbi:MAG: hypothetical protein WCY12_01845 [Candidatus Omnitrophota bacterium]
MEQKTKIIILGLVAILIVSLFVTLQTFSSKQSVEKERDNLKRENAALSRKVDEAMGEARRLGDKLNSFNTDLIRVNQEKEELEKKFVIINKERQDLADQLTAVKSKRQAAEAASAISSVPVSEDAYWASLVKAKTDLEFQLESLRVEFKNAQIKNAALLREKGSMELELTNLNREAAELRRQLGYNQKLMDSIAQELVREKNDKFAIEGNIKTIKNDNSLLRRQLKAINSRKDNLEEKLVSMQQQNISLNRRIDEMQNVLQDRNTQIDSLKTKVENMMVGLPPSGGVKKDVPVELPPITVRPQAEKANQKQAPSPAMLSVTGKIVAINRENNFVVVDLGDDAGIKLGDTFQAYNREGVAIASLEVIQTRKNISACDIRKENATLAVGDTVR